MTPAPTPDIWIDATAALTQRAGIARYVRDLTRAMLAQKPTGHHIGTYSHSWNGEPEPFGVPHAGTYLSARPWRIALLIGHATRQKRIPGLSAYSRFLATNLAFPYGDPEQVIATVHDLSPITHPHTHSSLTRLHTRVSLAILRERRYRLIAVSHKTAADLVQHANIDPTRITVIHSGVSEYFTVALSQSAIDQVLSKYRISRPFVLTVGTLEPRKNLRRLIDAFQRISIQSESLVIVGGRGWGRDANLAEAMSTTTNIHVVGHVSDQDLKCLYHACAVFVMPSLDEGYGFPVVEALACGAPVLCSTKCGVMEVVRDLVTNIEPENHDSMAFSLRHAIDNAKTAHRASQVPRTWAAAAKDTWTIVNG